jgi:hypothetical protein
MAAWSRAPRSSRAGTVGGDRGDRRPLPRAAAAFVDGQRVRRGGVRMPAARELPEVPIRGRGPVASRGAEQQVVDDVGRRLARAVAGPPAQLYRPTPSGCARIWPCATGRLTAAVSLRTNASRIVRSAAGIALASGAGTCGAGAAVRRPDARRGETNERDQRGTRAAACDAVHGVPRATGLRGRFDHPRAQRRRGALRSGAPRVRHVPGAQQLV